MKVTLKALWNSGQAVDRLAALEFATAKRGYQVGRIHKGATSELEPLKKAYLKLLRKHGTEVKDDAGKGTDSFYVPAGTDIEEAFSAEWNDVLAQEVEIWGDPISLTAIEVEQKAAGTPLKIAARDIGALDWLLTE